MPIAGFTRFRQWAFSAAQSAHGTAATPARAYAYRGTPEINPNWTVPDDIDMGSVDDIILPYRTMLDTTATAEGPVIYDEIPLPLNAGVRGAVTPTGGGAAKTWTHTALSTTATTLDEFSAQWGDDFTSGGLRFRDGIVEQIEYTLPEDQGPWRVSTQWYFGSVNHGVTPVVLTQGSNPVFAYGADTQLFIDDSAAGIGSTAITDGLHSARIRITNTVDHKRFANGSNSRFAVAGYGFSRREIEFEFTFAETSATYGALNSEMVDNLRSSAITRYISVVTTSPEIITGVTPYSWTQNLAGVYTQPPSFGEIGGNSTVTLAGRGRYDSVLGYIYRAVTVNARAALP